MAIVTKEYLCTSCEKEFEIDIQHDKNRKKCIHCGKHTLERIISCPIISKVGGPRTLGTLMEKNNKNNPLSREKAVGSENDEKFKWQQKVEKLKRMSPDQKEKYIRTGKGVN